MSKYVGQVIRCPKDVCETTYLFIWSDATHTQSELEKWELKVVPCDKHGDQVDGSKSFDVTLEEMKRWGN